MSTAIATPAAEKIAITSTTKLQKSVEELSKVVDGLKHTVNIHDDLTQAIAEKEQTFQALETKYAEEARRRQVDLDLSFREIEAKKVDEVLARQSKIAVVKADFETLTAAYTALKTDFAKQLDAESGKIKGMESARAAAAIKEAQLEMAVKEAQNSATINTLEDKIDLLNTQVEDYKGQIIAERQARVQEAQARGAAMVTVNSGK